MPADGDDVVAFENRFPSLRGPSTISGTGGPPDPPDLDDGLSACTFRSSPSGGHQASSNTSRDGIGPGAVWVNDIAPETAARRLREA